MDGFATISQAADRYAYTQYLPEDLPNYWHWAERFVLGDNFFASAQGPSFPNHLFAKNLGFTQREFFEVSDAAAIAEPPRVQF